MPLLAVTKVKRVNSSPLFINAQTMMGGNGARQSQQQTTLHAALQIRSATFQVSGAESVMYYPRRRAVSAQYVIL